VTGILDDERVDQIINLFPLDLPLTEIELSEKCIAFIKLCGNYNPEERPTAENAFEILSQDRILPLTTSTTPIKNISPTNDTLSNSIPTNDTLLLIKCKKCGSSFTFEDNHSCRYHSGNRLTDLFGINPYQYKWSCCNRDYFKLKNGHSRNSNNDLELDSQGKYVADHSTGCQPPKANSSMKVILDK